MSFSRQIALLIALVAGLPVAAWSEVDPRLASEPNAPEASVSPREEAPVEEDFFEPKVQSQAEGLAQFARIVARACEKRSVPPRLQTPQHIPFPHNYVSQGKKSREPLMNLDFVKMSGYFDLAIKGGGYLSAESLWAKPPGVLEPVTERREYQWQGRPFARLNAQIRGQALALYFLEMTLDEAQSKILYSWKDAQAHPLFMKWGRKGHVETTAVMIVVVPDGTTDTVIGEVAFWNALESALPPNSAFPRGRMSVAGYPRPFGAVLIPDWLYDTLHFERLIIGL